MNQDVNNDNNSNIKKTNDVEILDLDDDVIENDQTPSIITISNTDVMKEVSQVAENTPKMISPEDVFEEVKKTQPKMISPEDVLEQVGTKETKTSTPSTADTSESNNEDTITTENKAKELQPKIVIPSDVDAVTATTNIEPKKNIPTPVSTVVIPNVPQEPEEKEPKKKKNILIIILPIILLCAVVVFIVFSNDIFGPSETKKPTPIEKKTGATITNNNGNAYFYPPIENKTETGSSNETTYYILGEENSGQKDLYDQLLSLYKKESENKTFDGANEKIGEIGPIKEKNIWLVLPTNYYLLNERIIKSNSKDGSIIVISSENGVTSKVEEHLRLMNQLGATKTLIFINKLNDTDETSSIKTKVKKVLKASGYDESKTPIIEGNVKEKESIEKLYQSMNDWIDIIKDSKEKDAKAHIIAVQKEGKDTSVIEIELESGTIKKGDKLELIYENEKKEVVVKSISVNKEARDEINSQETLEKVYLSINQKYSEKLKNAIMIVTKGSVECHNKFKAIFYYEKSQYSQNSETFGSGYKTTIQLQKHIDGTISIPSTVKYIAQNDTTNMTIVLDENTPLFIGQQFSINDTKDGVFGYGQITEIVR